MIRKLFGISVLLAAAISLLNSSSCARNQQLTSINIQPGNGTFAAVDPTAYFIYKAYGTYIHPPQTLDITNKVTWQSDNPQVANFTSPGVISPTQGCGVAQIFAAMHQDSNDVVSNLVSITVDGPPSLGCPQGTATFNLSVDVTAGSTDGVIASSPAGITCGATCAAPFPSGSSVALTATPNTGKIFNGWASCPSVSGQGGLTCTVMMNSDTTISGSFN